MKPRALCLVSGGLDSLLARQVIAALGVEVRAVHFDTGFGFGRDRAAWPEVQVVDVQRDYLLRVVSVPRFGYGSAMNPCQDCRIFLLHRAWAHAAETGCGFLVTGEVVGQRAFDQSRSALERTEREAGVEGKVLRPLCGALLPATEAEQRGWVAREALLRLHGSGRRGQLELARSLGWEAPPTPSGRCCRLADPAFARRLRDCLAHRDAGSIDREELELLARGRHLRLSWETRLVAGRDEEESGWLADSAGGRWVCRVESGRGAVVLVDGEPGREGLEAAASVAARYSRDRDRTPVAVLLRRGTEVIRMAVEPAEQEQLDSWRI